MKFTIFASNKMTNILVYGSILMLCFGAVFYSVYSDYRGKEGGEQVVIDVKEGMTINDIIPVLDSSRVVTYPGLFRAYLMTQPEIRMDVARYAFNKDMSYEALAQALRTPIKPQRLELTIPEGLEIYNLAQRVEDLGIATKQQFLQECEAYLSQNEFVKEIPNRENRLEGYLFPETYFLNEAATAKDVIDICISQFTKVMNPEYVARAAQLNMTVDQIVILASVIEREAASEDEMATVSSVFHNRLRSNPPMKLESCATIQYVLQERKAVLSNEDTRIESQYNTYKYSGLPIGPIASPGEAAIKAALYPDDTPYFYFRLDDNGKSRFSVTFEEHLG